MPFNEIQADRLNLRLAAELGIGDQAPAPTLAPEIQPVIIVEAERPENLILQRDRRFITHITQAGVAGEYTYIALYNPAGGNMLAVIEKVCVSKHTSVQACAFGPASSSLYASLSAGTTWPLDTRVANNVTGRTSWSIIYRGTDPLNNLMSIFARLKIGVDSTSDMEQHELGYVLSPGNGFAIGYLDATNLGSSGYIIWRERAALPGELR